MNSFQAKIVWKKMRKREIKIIVPFRFYPRRDRKFQKNGKKIQKFKKNIVATFTSQNRLEKAEKERK